LKAIINISG